MKANEGLKMHGALTMTIQRANGDTETIRKDNIIVDVGFDFIADAIGESASRPGVMSHIAVGSGTASPSADDTALETEITRQAAAYAHSAGTKTMTFTASFPAGVGTGAITEAGVINSPSGGILLDRVTFGVINKGADDSMTATFTFTMS